MTTSSALPASLLLAIGLNACGASSSDTPQIPIGGAADSEDGSELSRSLRPVSLRLLSEHDVTPAGKGAHRPDVTAVGGELWLAYGAGDGHLELQRFDADLNALGGPLALEDGIEPPTDVRVGLAQGQFWYAYETVAIPDPDCQSHFLNAAAYSTSPPQLALSARHLASGCPTTIQFVQNPSGVPENPEAVDDPTPFFHKAKRYVLTRAWPVGGSTLHHVRELDEELRVTQHVLLDTGAELPGLLLGQNVLLHLEGQPFLVAGFFSGPPQPPHSARLFALRLSDDLRGFLGPALPLSVQGATYPFRITRGRHVNGTLIINFVDQYEGQPTREFLALFDSRAEFALLDQIQVQDHEVMDNHSSFEVLGDRLYLFQQQTGERMSGKIFALEP